MYGYRDIEPINSFKGEAHPLKVRQFHWTTRSKGLETAIFAGKEMMVCINDDESTYQLTYLDMAHTAAFPSIEEAKEAAFDFARAVLLYMLAFVGVRENDASLQTCISKRGC